MTVLYILAAVAALGILIMVHEFGHFAAARLTGIPVKEFSIGFGTKIIQWKSKKHDTLFSLRVIPAGGYCMFYDEDATDGHEDERSFHRCKAWKRLLSVAMGPVMNFLLAFIVSVIFIACTGVDNGGVYGYPVISTVNAGSAAEAAGFQPGDTILAVNGTDMSGTPYNEDLKITRTLSGYKAEDGGVNFTVLRGDQTLSLNCTPVYDEAEGRFLIGIMHSTAYTPDIRAVSPGECISLGASYCWEVGGAILKSLKDMITTGTGLKETTGVVGVVQYMAEETRDQGWSVFVWMLVMISVNLGLVNLIPIPGLDGSRIIFLLIEIIFRKPVNRKVEAYIHTVGYILLFFLMIVLLGKDIIHIFR